MIQEEVFTTEYRTAMNSSYPQSNSDYGFITSSAPMKTFKDEVQECLKAKFGLSVKTPL